MGPLLLMVMGRSMFRTRVRIQVRTLVSARARARVKVSLGLGLGLMPWLCRAIVRAVVRLRAGIMFVARVMESFYCLPFSECPLLGSCRKKWNPVSVFTLLSYRQAPWRWGILLLTISVSILSFSLLIYTISSLII